MKNNCPICNSEDIENIIEIHDVPVFQNMLYYDFENAIDAPKGEISVCVCKECGFHFNSSFDDHKLMYNENYDNRQDNSKQFQNHVCEIVEFINRNCTFQNKKVLEIGCGTGYFLNCIAKDYHCTCIGYDPSYVTEKLESENKNISFVQKFFTEDDIYFCSEKPDIIIMRHVLEHLQNPLEMLQILKKALKENGGDIIYIETPSYDWIVENNTLFDYIYEHCSYFSDSFLPVLFKMAGLEIITFKHTFGGQYLSIIAKVSQDNKATKYLYSAKEGNSFAQTKYKVEQYLSLEVSQNICLWGAGGKGTMFCNLFDPNRRIIAGVIDINEKKQGCFIPGTGHPIFSPEILKKEKIHLIIVMNGNYFAEIQSMVSQINSEISVVNIENILNS